MSEFSVAAINIALRLSPTQARCIESMGYPGTHRTARLLDLDGPWVFYGKRGWSTPTARSLADHDLIEHHPEAGNYYRLTDLGREVSEYLGSKR